MLCTQSANGLLNHFTESGTQTWTTSSWVHGWCPPQIVDFGIWLSMASFIPENPRQGHVLAKSSIGKQRLELCMSQHFRDRLLAVVGFDHPILVCPILINFDSCPNRFFLPEKQTPRPLSFRKKRTASVSPLCGSKKRLGFRWWLFFAEWPRKTRGSAGL